MMDLDSSFKYLDFTAVLMRHHQRQVAEALDAACRDTLLLFPLLPGIVLSGALHRESHPVQAAAAINVGPEFATWNYLDHWKPLQTEAAPVLGAPIDIIPCESVELGWSRPTEL